MKVPATIVREQIGEVPKIVAVTRSTFDTPEQRCKVGQTDNHDAVRGHRTVDLTTIIKMKLDWRTGATALSSALREPKHRRPQRMAISAVRP